MPDKLHNSDNELELVPLPPKMLVPFTPIYNDAGELVGAETYEVMTVAEFKRRYPELAERHLTNG